MTDGTRQDFENLARDVLVVSRPSSAEATLAVAIKDELEELGLFAVDWPPPRSGAPAGTLDASVEDSDDRGRIANHLVECSVTVFILPRHDRLAGGSAMAVDELRASGRPVVLVYWSPQVEDSLEDPDLRALNVIWSHAVAGGEEDIGISGGAPAARQIAHACWMACLLRSLQTDHPDTAARLFLLNAARDVEPLLNYRLSREEVPTPASGDGEDPRSVARLVVELPAEAELARFVHTWRRGTDLLASHVASEAQLSLARPIRYIHAACEALCSESCRRFPALATMPGDVLTARGLMLTRLNRLDEAVETLIAALSAVTGGDRFEVYQSLVIALRDSDPKRAIINATRALACSPSLEVSCTIRYQRGLLRAICGERAARQAADDFSFVVDHSTDGIALQTALRARARVRSSLSDMIGAVADYTRLLDHGAVTPRSAVAAWIDRAALHKLQGRQDQAIEDWSRAIESVHADPDERLRSLEARGQAFEEAGRFLAAAADYDAMAEVAGIRPVRRDELRRNAAKCRAAATP